MKLSIISPEGTAFENEVDEVILPTPNGEISILPHHTTLFTKMDSGTISVKMRLREDIIATVGGFVEVKKDQVTVLSDYAVKADNIQIAKAQEAKSRAEEAMKKKGSDIDFIVAEKELQKSIMELHVAHKIKKRQSYR